jgi:tryptophan synthase alpha chain
MTAQTGTQNRYDARFQALRSQGGKAFIPFTLLGWPDRETSLQIIKAMIDSGASALELGLAFSDPVVDGPIIQEAAMETLAAGFTVDDALALLGDVRKLDAEIPIGLLVYYNLVLSRGIEQCFADLARAGVDGVLIPDLPPERAEEVLPAAQRHGIHLIYILSPLTDTERLAAINRHAGGFLYVLSRLGITGTEERYDDTLKTMLSQARTQTSLPLCVGFGVSTPEQARTMIAAGADGAITGSRIIQLIRQSSPEKRTHELEQYLKSMVAAMNP